MAIILGIDPGSRVTGYGLINAVGNRLEFVDCGCVFCADGSLSDRLQTIFSELTQVIESFSPQQAAIEEVFMGRNPQSAIKLGQARGSAIVACSSQKLPVEHYSPRQIKQAVVGAGSAEKSQVQHMVKALLRLPEIPAEDAADALAVAICHANTSMALVKLAGAKGFSRGRLRG